MNDDLIVDLKQFITATVQQATADLATKEDLSSEIGAVRSEIGTLRSEMCASFDSLELKLETIADAQAEQLDDHEQRLVRLERHTAS